MKKENFSDTMPMLKDILTLAEVYILLKNLGQKNEQTNFFIMLIIHRLCSKKEFKHCVVKKVTVAIT
jgi:hypothetical protein